MILLVDNYDSFSYNLYQLVGSIEPDIRVIRNDELSVPDIAGLAPSAVILSPGPGRPEGAGVSISLVKRLGPKVPILGVCLGHQAICAAYGATVTYAKELMHGKQSEVELMGVPLFEGVSSPARVARYHSLAADPQTIPDCLTVTARTADGEVMAVQHAEHPVYGLQFHPESILTPDGRTILANFLRNGKENHA